MFYGTPVTFSFLIFLDQLQSQPTPPPAASDESRNRRSERRRRKSRLEWGGSSGINVIKLVFALADEED
jgi:hypothetical protein